GRRLRESGAIEFVHRWEQLVGGMCRAGFAIEDLAEPLHTTKDAVPGSFADRASYVAPYVRIKARRTGLPSAPDSAAPNLWIPDSPGSD
ncbi:MAG: class I SAM-dependent methyltransferase, partial [Pirellulales bacterium]|nr:class I SAM-dependent methyltransferase [Pirellulales bacterium]